MGKTFQSVAMLTVAWAVSSCDEVVHYNNRDPGRTNQAQFDKDNYECDRENTHVTAVAVSGYASSGPEVDSGMAARCMQVRGWYRVQ